MEDLDELRRQLQHWLETKDEAESMIGFYRQKLEDLGLDVDDEDLG